MLKGLWATILLVFLSLNAHANTYQRLDSTANLLEELGATNSDLEVLFCDLHSTLYFDSLDNVHQGYSDIAALYEREITKAQREGRIQLHQQLQVGSQQMLQEYQQALDLVADLYQDKQSDINPLERQAWCEENL